MAEADIVFSMLSDPAAVGASFKMLVNVMLAQSMVKFSETVLLGEKMGLDRE